MKIRIKETGEELEVKKDCGEILVCWLSEPIRTKWDSVVTICIISRDKVEILEEEDSQLKMFP